MRLSKTGNRIPAGKLILISNGQYSSYEVFTVVEVLQEFDAAAELRSYYEQHPEQRGEYRMAESQFITWLIERGLIKEIDYGEFYLQGRWDHTKKDGQELDFYLEPDQDY